MTFWNVTNLDIWFMSFIGFNFLWHFRKALQYNAESLDRRVRDLEESQATVVSILQAQVKLEKIRKLTKNEENQI